MRREAREYLSRHARRGISDSAIRRSTLGSRMKYRRVLAVYVSTQRSVRNGKQRQRREECSERRDSMLFRDKVAA